MTPQITFFLCVCLLCVRHKLESCYLEKINNPKHSVSVRFAFETFKIIPEKSKDQAKTFCCSRSSKKILVLDRIIATVTSYLCYQSFHEICVDTHNAEQHLTSLQPCSGTSEKVLKLLIILIIKFCYLKNLCKKFLVEKFDLFR